MPISIDWTALGVIVSLITSAVTLYLAHLRGSDVELAMPNRIYPCHGLFFAGDMPGNKETTLQSRLLVANVGNRPGILFSFRVDAADSIVEHFDLDPWPDNLPVSLSPGEGWTTTLTIYIKKPKSGHSWKDWETHVASGEGVLMEAAYSVSTSFPWRRHKKAQLRIDLAPLRAAISSFWSPT